MEKSIQKVICGKYFPLQASQYANKWKSGVSITLNMVENFHLLTLLQEMKKILRITIPIILIVVAIIYFNSAFFSAWISGGPPNDYPEAWAYRSFKHFYYGLGFIVFAITLFIALKPNAKRIKTECVIGLVLAFILFTTPQVKNFIKIDSCLDQGVRWNENYHKCEK